MTVVAGSEDARDLVNTICEVVGRLGLPVRARTLEQTPAGGEETSSPGLARAEIDLTEPSVAVVRVYGKSGQLVLMQRFARTASAPVLREEIADAVRSAVEAQLLIEPERPGQPASPGTETGGQAPIPTGRSGAWVSPFSAAVPPVAEPPALVLPAAPSVAPSAPPAPSGQPSGEATSTPKAIELRGVAVDLSALAGAGTFSKRAVVVGRVGGQATLAYRNWVNPSLVVTGEWVVPFEVARYFEAGRDRVAADANVASLRIVPAIQVFHTSKLAIDVGAGAGIDVLSVAPSTAPPTPHIIVNGGPIGRTDPVLRGLAAAYLGLAPRLSLSLNLACDVDVATLIPGYEVQDGPTGYYVLLPGRVRTELLLGLTLAALGETRFSSGILR